MSEYEIREVIKAFAYGFTAERVAMECDISVEQAEEIRKNHSEEINERRTASYE